MNPPSSDAALKNYYATRAPYYDAVYDKPERREDIAFLQQFLPARLAQRTVLEVACGTGYWTQFIAPATRPGYRALANFWVFEYEAGSLGLVDR